MRTRPHPGNLREVADQLVQATGMRVQVMGGSLLMSLPLSGKQAKVVRRIEAEVGSALPSSLVTVARASVEMPGDPDDYVSPDLTVCRADFLDSDDWLLEPPDVELAVEVVPQSEKARGISQKQDWYAVAGVKALLVVDPRGGTWGLHTRPDAVRRCYQEAVRGKFGEGVVLPPPLGIAVSTEGFPVYGVKGP